MTDFNDFNIDNAASRLNLIDLPELVRPPDRRQREPILINQPRAARALENKYSGYFRDLESQYDQSIVNAMIDFDASRVERGQNPLSEEETRRALQTAQTGEQATPEPKRGIAPWNIPGNAMRNLGDIVKALPQLPTALAKEVTGLGDIGTAMSEGKNPIHGIATAPGLRMLPGAYVAENIAGGTPGELLRNPLFTALDVLPLANQAAKGTKIATQARETALAIGRGEVDATAREAARINKMARRPMATRLNNMLDKDGNIIRSPLGEFIDQATEARMLRPMKQWFSQSERDVMFSVGAAGQRVHNIVTGVQKPVGQLDELAREAYGLRKRLEELDPKLLETDKMADITSRMTTGNLDGLGQVELQALEMYRDSLSRVTDWAVKENYLTLFDGEVYDVPTGLRLRAMDATIKQQSELARARNAILAGQADPATLLDGLRSAYGRPRTAPSVGKGIGKKSDADRLAEINAGAISEADVNAMRQTTMRALESSGFDVSHFKTTRTSPKGKESTVWKKGDEFQQAVDDVAERRVVLTRTNDFMPFDEVMEVIRANKQSYPGPALSVLEAGLARGEWKVVTRALESLRKQRGVEALNDPRFIESVRNLRENAKMLAKTRRASDESLGKLQARLRKLQARSAPARFLPKVDEVTRAKFTDEMIERQSMIPADDAITAEKVIALADSQRWTDIPGFDTASDAALFRKIQKETAASWMDMKRKGFDPVFVHTVPVNKLSRVLYPAESVVPKTASSVHKRMMDMTPGVQDFSVAISDQMMEFLSRREIETAVKYIMDLKGETEATLRARYEGVARRRADRSPAKTFEGHLQDAMSESYRPFDPIAEGYNWGSPYLDRLGQQRMWIPKTTYNNLKALADPTSIMGGVFDPLNKAFRISVVGLSIRTQIYNIIGGAINVEAHAPGILMRQAGTIRKYLDDPNMVPDELAEMIGSKKQYLMQLDDVQQGRVVEGVANYMKGEKMRGWWDDIQARKVEGRPITKFGGMINGLAEKAYTLNGFFDDMYRVAAYFDEYEKSIAKGFTDQKAAQAGISQARKVLQDWMGMTPMERSVMRSLVPFYAFLSHATRFVFRYPLDHPLRTEFITKLAMAELEDLDALPTRFLSNLFFGKRDEQGNQNAFNLAPVNPFSDVANMFTVSGFLGNANPAITTAMQMVGVDQGQMELYPSLRYDPETGRLRADTGNPLMALMNNTIPQTGLITGALGMNEEFNEMLQRDPAAANRFLLSTLTLPIAWRQWNVPQEQFKAEVARYGTEQTVMNEALKTGDWSEALNYPSLAKYLAALDSMPDDQLSPFRQIEEGTGEQLARNVLSGGAPVVPSASPLNDQIKELLDAQANTLMGAQTAASPNLGAGRGVRSVGPIGGRSMLHLGGGGNATPGGSLSRSSAGGI